MRCSPRPWPSARPRPRRRRRSSCSPRRSRTGPRTTTFPSAARSRSTSTRSSACSLTCSRRPQRRAATRVFVVNAHGGNAAACVTAVTEASRRARDRRGDGADRGPPRAGRGRRAASAATRAASRRRSCSSSIPTAFVSTGRGRRRAALLGPANAGSWSRSRAAGSSSTGSPTGRTRHRPSGARLPSTRACARSRAPSRRSPVLTSDGAGPTIAAVETTVVTAHAKPGLRVRGARVVHDASSFVLVRVITDEGVEGYGEISATAAWSGEDHVTATHFVRDVFAPRLIGAPLAPVERHGVELDRVVRGNWFTKAGVDTALWDALGRTLGQPVAELLGGPFRRRGADQDLAQRRRRRPARRLRDRGRRSASGRSRSRSGAIPTPTSPASGWRASSSGTRRCSESTRTAAGRARWRSRPCRASPSSSIAFVEQPVAPDDLEGMRRVRALGIPVVADESVYSAADVERVVRSGAADVVSIYVGKSSGLQRAVAAARARLEPRGRCRDRIERRDGPRSRRPAPRRLCLRAARLHPLRHHRAPLLRRRPDARGASRDRGLRRQAPGRPRARRAAERGDSPELRLVIPGVQVFVYPEELRFVSPEALAAQVSDLGCDAVSMALSYHRARRVFPRHHHVSNLAGAPRTSRPTSAATEGSCRTTTADPALQDAVLRFREACGHGGHRVQGMARRPPPRGPRGAASRGCGARAGREPARAQPLPVGSRGDRVRRRARRRRRGAFRRRRRSTSRRGSTRPGSRRTR